MARKHSRCYNHQTASEYYDRKTIQQQTSTMSDKSDSDTPSSAPSITEGNRVLFNTVAKEKLPSAKVNSLLTLQRFVKKTMAQSIAETESKDIIKEVGTVIERIMSKIICKIIEDLPVFKPTYQGCQTENDFKKVDFEEVAQFCEESSRASQRHCESSSIISISHFVNGQDVDLGSTESEAALNFHQILSDRVKTDKSKEILSDQTCKEVIDSCEKEQLLFALQLSPVSKLKQFKYQERHERGTKCSVYFSSPVAEICEYSERSQTASDGDTQIILDSVSDVSSSQATQLDVSAEQSDLACGILDRAEFCLYMTAGGDCLNARINENISLDDTHQGKTNEQEDKTQKRNILSLEMKMGQDNPNDNLNSTKNIEDKPVMNYEDVQLSQTYNASDTKKQIKEMEESDQELNKLLELDGDQYSGSIEDITTCSGDFQTFSHAAKLPLGSVSLERSFKTAQDTLMEQTEQCKSDENSAVFVSCRNNSTDVLIENRELCVEEDKSQALFNELNKLHEKDLNEESENDDSRDVRDESGDVMENNTLNGEACILAATSLKDFNNTETVNEHPITFSDFQLAHNIHTDNNTIGNNYDVKEVFTKISLEHVDQGSSSQDMFLNGNETFTFKKQSNQFQLKLTSNSENVKNVAKTKADISQSSAALNENFIECYSKKNEIDGIDKIMKDEIDESAEEIKKSTNQGIIRKSIPNSGNVNDGNDEIIKVHGDNMIFQIGKREQSSPDLFGLSKKSKSDPEIEKRHTASRKRKLFEIELVENGNVKMFKLQKDSIPNHIEENAFTPKMLKQLAQDTLTELEENVLWNSAEVEQELSKQKENDAEETLDKEVLLSIENKETSSNIKNISNFLKKLTDELEPPYGSLEVQIQENDTILPDPEAKEVQLSEHKEEAVLDVSRAQNYIEAFNTETVVVPSDTSFELKDTADSQNTQESQGFITAMEFLSQSSQNSGSIGFTDDMYRNGTTDNAHLQIERERSTDQWLENESDRKLKKTKNIVEITKDSFEEEKIDDEVEDISVSDFVKSKNEWYSCRHTVTDQDEQIDTDQLDMFVDKAVDQLVPDEDVELADNSVEADRGNSACKYERDQKLTLYACDSDICDEQGGLLCKPVNKIGNLYEKCFNWKYRPSCDTDLDCNVPELPDEDHVVRVTPLKTCGKPLRLGLSRRQPVKTSLHKLGGRKELTSVK